MINVDVLKAHLGTDQVKTDPDRDTVLPLLEAAAVDFVQQETGRHFGASTTITEYVDGNGDRAIWIGEAPASLTSVHVHDQPGDDWEEILAGDADGFELRGRRVIRKGGACWERCREYRFVYDFGYAAGAEPPEIRDLVTQIVAVRWRQRGIEGHVSGSIGDYSFGTAMTRPWSPSEIYAAIPAAQEIIDRWRGAPVVAG